MDGYKLAGKLAEGMFGVVFEGCNMETGDKVAIKKIRARRLMPGHNVDPWSKSAEREVEILSQVRHHHIVRLLDHDLSPATGIFVLVFELLAWDLDAMLERHKPLEESKVKILMQMLLTGLAYLHRLEVMHRDIKPSNLLLEAATGCLKIADFGSARFSPGCAAMPPLSEQVLLPSGHKPSCMESELDMLEPEQPLTREVCTRWYKSPEMLFGSTDYDNAVDLWATGCVLGVLLSPTAQPLFDGQSDIDQLCCIFKLRGTPHEEEWPEVKLLPDFNKIEFTACAPQPFVFSSEGSCCSPEAVQLLEDLLQLNPAMRVAAANALAGNYFQKPPAVADPRLLVSLLGEPRQAAKDDDFGSDGSDFASPDWEFEAIPIETTSCGLWDGAVAAGTPSEEPARSGHSTPPPPKSGAHRFKLGVL